MKKILPLFPLFTLLITSLACGGTSPASSTLAPDQFDTAVAEAVAAQQTPGMTWLNPDQLHLGGGYNVGLSNITRVYYSLENPECATG